MTEKKSEIQILAILDANYQEAVSYCSPIFDEMDENLKYYDSDNDIVTVMPGRSAATTSDAQDVVESILPSLMRIFTAGERVVQYDPVEPGDEIGANQATDFANWSFYKDNDGYGVLYDTFKNSLVSKVGYIKQYYCEENEKRIDERENISSAELVMLIADGTKIKSRTTKFLDGTDITDKIDIELISPEDETMVHDVTFEIEEHYENIREESVPPKEVVVLPNTRNLRDCNYCCHRVYKTRSDLLEAGYPKKIVDSLPSSSEGFLEDLALNTPNQDYGLGSNTIDKAMEKLLVKEHYIKIDLKNNGFSELRKITEVEGVILDNEPIVKIPLYKFTPIPIPGQFFGKSVVDIVKHGQKVTTTLLRQMLDAVYLTNNPMLEVNVNSITKESVQALRYRKIGSVVASQDGASVRPIPTQGLNPQSFTLFELMNSMKEARTGITRLNQGLDADSLNKTATGITKLMDASQVRMELLARIFANQLKEVFADLLYLSSKYVKRQKIIRLTNNFVVVDPKEFNHKMDVSINVGLGTGDKVYQTGQLMNILALQEKVLVSGLPMVTESNIYNALSRIVESSGIQNPDAYFTSPDSRESEQLRQKQSVNAAQQQQAQQAETQEKRVKLEQEQQRIDLAGAKETRELAKEMGVFN